MEMHGEIADRYRDFATYARGDSPTFEAWALGLDGVPVALTHGHGHAIDWRS